MGVLGNSELGQQVMAFRGYRWTLVSELARVSQLSRSVPNGCSTSLPMLEIYCRRYVPHEGDIVPAKCHDQGQVTHLELPTYACDDTKKLVGTVRNFLMRRKQQSKKIS